MLLIEKGPALPVQTDRQYMVQNTTMHNSNSVHVAKGSMQEAGDTVLLVLSWQPHCAAMQLLAKQR